MTETPQLISIHEVERPSGWRRARVLALVLVPALVLGGVGVAHAHKTITLDVDGDVQQVSTFAGSVDSLLTSREVDYGEHDVITPDPNAPLRDGETVVVRIAEPFEVMIDGEVRTVWTTADTAADALGELAESGRHPSIVAASRSLDRQELTMPLVVNGTVRISDAGKLSTLEVQGPATYAGVLEQAGIEVHDTDEVRIRFDDGAPLIQIDRVVLDQRTETETLAFSTTKEKTDSLYVGQSKVKQAGKNGEVTRVYDVTIVNGVEKDATLVNEKRTEPVTKVVQVGTKKRPAAKAAPAASSSGGGGAAPSGGVWAALARCESGGNPRAVSASGAYHGLYQFSVGTWRSVGGSGLPSQASAAEQTKRAKMLQARSGWGQWPYCSKKLGLR
ncbi:MAG: ubiquitin-like domain-containing protein [Bowdeniella nasicola]|nr:ubiquitin-like domain-containing protein [Bowdeniella nasicola]